MTTKRPRTTDDLTGGKTPLSEVMGVQDDNDIPEPAKKDKGLKALLSFMAKNARRYENKYVITLTADQLNTLRESA